MSSDKPQARFLARSSVLTIGLLALWWFVLLNPLLVILRGSAEILGGVAVGLKSGKLITEIPSGDWSITVPRELVIPNTLEHPGPTRTMSIEFTITRSDAAAFTFSLPLYWAIALAAPVARKRIRPFVLGTILVAVLEAILLLFFIEISARNVAAELTQSHDGIAKWFLNLGYYLMVNVIPYMAPFVTTMSVDRELRRQILGWENSQPMLADGPRLASARAWR